MARRGTRIGNIGLVERLDGSQHTANHIEGRRGGWFDDAVDLP
jgi:hypothetical protein